MAFASPARDFNDKPLDLDQLIIHRSSTYYMRARGAMASAGISDGDILVIDKSLEPRHGDIAVCRVEGGLELRRLKMADGVVELLTDNLPLPVKKLSDDTAIWGVVSIVIKKLR